MTVSLFSFSESEGIGGAGASGQLWFSARVGFARMLLGASWVIVGLRFAIAGGCRARSAVDVKSCLLRVVVSWFFDFSTVMASRAVVVLIESEGVAIGSMPSGGSGGRLGPRSSPFDSGFSATIW